MAAETGSVTPMMAQFLEIKEGYPDAILFYRMGDFYEMFFDDAVLAAEALDIALTKRGKHAGKDIPMCGVPAHASENYLQALIKKGFRVAVCDQLESPVEAKKRGYKAVVKRGVVRLVTPGTLTEETLLDARQHNFLCAFADVRGESALAWADISTGDFSVQVCPKAGLSHLIARLAPQEVLVSPQSVPLFDDTNAVLTEMSRSSFDSTNAEARLKSLFDVQSLDGFGGFGRAELAAMGALVDYLDITQKGKLPNLRPPVQESMHSSMRIDSATRRNLELTRTMIGDRKGSLLGVIDQTITGAGARLLEVRLSNPSTDRDIIQKRLDAVSHFVDHAQMRDAVQDQLRQTPDMDRSLGRLSLDRGGPRDISAIQKGLAQAELMVATLQTESLPDDLAAAATQLQGHEAFFEFLKRALVENPPLLSRDGGFVADGYDEELDEARKLRDEGRQVISALQANYIKKSGVSSLKIKHNNVLGYFIETPASHANTMLGEPLSETFIHRQTTANAVRFTTLELSEMETKILNAGGRALEIEKRIFEELRGAVLEYANEIAFAARAMALVDVQSALGDLAIKENWVRPSITKDRAFRITGGRHPVVERALRSEGTGNFVSNDCDLSCDSEAARRLWLLTGPNMAGKSTFLRQNALIAVLAQMGSFVPAQTVEIGVVSQLFSRVGASDDLARGRSTFMVEMVETAAILNQADENALVILDEIGRGTATYDGLSIAWATLEHLHEINQCRALFATHYHELTHLSNKLDGLMNTTISVREWEGEIIFLHEVKLGAADRSYGVQVAQLAGLPASVVERARVVLEKLEQRNREGGATEKDFFEDLPLFAAPAPIVSRIVQDSEVEKALGDILPDELSPKEALALIYDLKTLLDSKPS